MDAELRHLLCFSLFLSGLYHLTVLAALAFVREEKKICLNNKGWYGFRDGAKGLFYCCLLMYGREVFHTLEGVLLVLARWLP